MNVSKIAETALRLFPPFLGLVSWKYKIPASALYHSLSVAVIAEDIARLLTDDEDEVELATYAGLVHDFYQKGSSVGLTASDGEKILRTVLEESGVDRKIVEAVVNEAARYNIAENPAIWASRYPVAGLSIWLADTIAGATSAFTVESNIWERAGRLDQRQRELLESLRINVVSITIPQVALRSRMYLEAVKKLRGAGNVVPIVARDGLLVVSNKELQPVELDIDDFRLDDNVFDIVYGSARKNAPTLTRSSFDERVRPELFSKGSSSKIPLEESVKGSFINVSLVNVSWASGSGYRCVFCGLPVSEPIHPASVGYFLYAKSSLERWSPRVPAVGVNLNRFFRDQWLKAGVVACPLCVLDSIEVWRLMNTNKIKSADYFVQMYFPLPTHYDLAQHLSRIAKATVSLEPSEVIKIVEESYESPGQYSEHANSILKLLPDEPLLIDSTWALYFNVVEAEDGEYTAFASHMPGMARAVLFTGIYPLKFSSKLDPLTERRIISPAYPLYDVDPAYTAQRGQVPLLVALLSIIDALDDEINAKRGVAPSREDRVKSVMDYLRYPSSMSATLLVRHRAGRAVLTAYQRFRENPVGFFKSG